MRPVAIVLALMLGAPIGAQVFPKAEKDNIAEEIERAKKGEKASTPETPKDPPKDTPKDPPRTIDGQAALKRFAEVRDNLRKALNSEQRETAKVLDQFVPLCADYFGAQALLKGGQYKEASKAFKKLSIPGDDEVKNLRGEAAERAKELQSGRHYYYRMIADVLALYTYTENDSEFERMWTRAERQGQAVVKDLQQAISRKQVDETRGGITLRRLENWLKDEQAKWQELRTAEKALNDNPAELGNWSRMLNLVSARDREDISPDLATARAILTVIKEYWALDTAVKRGVVDVGLAWAHTSLFQFERALAALDGLDYLSDEGKRHVEDQKRRIQEAQNAALREYKK